MDIKTSKEKDTTVIAISGNIDGNTVNDAQETIMPMVGANALVLDLKKCAYISSAGLRLLLMAAKQTAAQGGSLALSGVSAEIMDVMEMTGFSNFFKVFDDVPSAVKMVGKGA